MVATATAAVFFSETVLSLYPILIKKVQTNLDTQTLSRFLIYPIAALVVGGLKPLANAYSHGISKNLALGAVNVGHIASSYLAFQQLPAGIAMSLFYTYPLWNLIGASLVFGEPFPWHLFPVLAIALGAAATIAFSRTEDRRQSWLSTSEPRSRDDQKHEGKEVNWLGVGAALVAALTETLIFLAVKSAPKETPFFSVHQIYLGGLPFLIGYLIWKSSKTDSEKPQEKQEQQPTIDWSFKTWLPLLLFNGILGFTGYCLRFWSIPRLSTLLYSVLSMFGVLAAFTWGHFIADEPVQGQGLIGAIVLTTCIGILRYFS